jgi:hypothetical protein
LFKKCLPKELAMLKAAAGEAHISALILEWELVGVADDDVDTEPLLKVNACVIKIRRGDIAQGSIHVLRAYFHNFCATNQRVGSKKDIDILEGSQVHEFSARK